MLPVMMLDKGMTFRQVRNEALFEIGFDPLSLISSTCIVFLDTDIRYLFDCDKALLTCVHTKWEANSRGGVIAYKVNGKTQFDSNCSELAWRFASFANGKTHLWHGAIMWVKQQQLSPALLQNVRPSLQQNTNYTSLPPYFFLTPTPPPIYEFSYSP